MGPLTKRQKRAHEQLKNSTDGRFKKLACIEENNVTNVSNNSEISVEDDFEILAGLEVEEAPEVDGVLEEESKPSFPIKWKESEATSSRGKYWGTSRTVKYYDNKQALKKKKGSHEITDFFKKKVNDKNSDEIVENPPSLMSIQEAYNQITPIVAPAMNAKKDNQRGMADYELRKYIGVYIYFGELIKKTPIMTASQIAAKTAWIVPSNYYRARAIRSYAQEYLHYGKISLHHTKPEKRGIPELLKYLNHTIIPSIFNLPGNISASVLWNYMVEWGYSYRATKKAVYYNGHERADVVQYRKEWASKIVEYNYFMEKYNEDDVTKVTLPDLLEGQKQIVMVTQDESTFYSNESPTNLWLVENENPIRNKSPGGSIMVSEFQCPCHGTMCIKNWKS
ncbi:hypothetical protein INT45_010217 [Circinella minor]|uniref:Uncharacterized protein n=1 Tax=Circinella minor TaxID=1195481 RepID=A0A8H7SEE0_9FUNG|nr:hypothetical protein INT45_010217 [Circinella minor]